MQDRNRSIDILRAITIILMVYGHYGAIPCTTGIEQLLPLASFHMPVFLFISGYLFHEISGKEYGRFIWKKTLHLAFPLIGWNIVYAGIVTILNLREVTNYVPPLESIWTFHNLLVEPFICGHQYMFNLATWFAGMLYVALIVYGLIHIASKRIPDWALLPIYFGIGVLGLWYSTLPQTNHWLMLPLHVSQALFYIHLGRCFRLYMEPFLARFNDFAVLCGLLVLWFISLRFVDNQLYVMIWMNYGGKIVQPLIAAAFGCMFWKKLTDQIAYYVRANKLETLISASTWQIMTHHLFVRFLLNWAFVYLILKDPHTQEVFRNDFWYKVPFAYFPLDMCLTVGLPVLWYIIWSKIKHALSRPYSSRLSVGD